MITVKAIYENGNIKLLEEVSLSDKQQLLITLLDNKNTEDIIRKISLQQSDSFNEYLKDEREDIYQDYLNTDR